MKATNILLTVITIFFCNFSFSQSYEKALQEVNNYLKTFDNGYYGYLEIEDGTLYDRYQSGEYSQSQLKFLSTATLEEKNKKVTLKCDDEKLCVFSTYSDSYHTQLSFSSNQEFNTSTLIDLLNNLIASYKNGIKSGAANDIPKTEKRRPERAK